MLGKSGKPIKINPWGDDNKEKLNESPQQTIGWGQQLKGLFNPDSFFAQSGEIKPSKAFHQPSKEKSSKSNEILVFSRTVKEHEQKIYQETNMVLQRLKEQVTILEKSNKGLVAEMSKVKVQQIPEKSGIYYIRFLEWLLTVVHQMRMKVEDGRTWLVSFTQKKKKMGYWKMYKKHGTTFGLSQERSLASQTG